MIRRHLSRSCAKGRFSNSTRAIEDRKEQFRMIWRRGLRTQNLAEYLALALPVCKQGVRIWPPLRCFRWSRSRHV